ncbi:MAG: oligosaccharide flippase family protein [Lachnospiraceae bacterium]|nr:oligosaccharide flippase family protein [Lachnospiraceae bacterium]
MSRETSLAKNTAIISIGTILPKVSWLITLPIITAKLTQAEYGTYDVISTLSSLFLPIATLQLQSAAFRFLVDCKEDFEKRDSIITNVIAFVTGTSIAALIILYFILYKLPNTVRILTCIYFFADILFAANIRIVRGLGRPMLYSLASAVQPIANMILVVFFVFFMNNGLEGALIAITVSTILSLSIILVRAHIISRFRLSLFSVNVLRELIAYSWPMVPNQLSSWFLNFSDRLILLQFIGINATAVYGVANKIPSLLTLMNSAFTMAWQENASINSKDEDVTVYYSSMFNTTLRILSGIMALLIAAVPLLFKFLIRGDYMDAYKQMPILLMAMLFAAISSFLGGIYIAHKKTKSVGVTTIIAAIINLLIDVLLVKEIGIYAASLSTLLAYVFLVIYRMKNVLNFQKINYNYVQIIKYICFLSVMCVFLWLNQLGLNILNVVLGIIFATSINYSLISSLINIIYNKIKNRFNIIL